MSASKLTKVYGSGETAVAALRDVDVEFARAEFAAIMGPSGSGKSTLMHCLAGLDRPTAGQVYVDGRLVSEMTEKQLTDLRRHTVGFVFQSFNLVPTLTAKENILLPSVIAAERPDREWYESIVAALGLEGRLGHLPKELSGGQQQRVACARALMARPAVVFADEPTGNLDSAAARDLLKFLRGSVGRLGQSIIMVTHDPVAAATAHRVVFLADGRVKGELRRPTTDGVMRVLRHLSQQNPQSRGRTW
ncbi:MAG: ABC transporter ATP-binding protein [Propionibacteriaceae bacterium]|nr:ABC transporter ATP-binding protein [Propionibacteriaceae bacterium]